MTLEDRILFGLLVYKIKVRMHQATPNNFYFHTEKVIFISKDNRVVNYTDFKNSDVFMAHAVE